MRNPEEGSPAELRRVDWRLLLPLQQTGIRHLALFGGSARQADLLLKTGEVERVSLDCPSPRSADAVVRLYNSRSDVREIAGCLAPGGAVYYEVDRRSPALLALSPGRLARRMESEGLAVTGIYWAAPDFKHCKRFIPLDLPEPIRWYFKTLYLAGTPLLSILETFIGLLTNLDHRRFRRLAPCYAVTATASPEGIRAPAILSQPDLPPALQDPQLRPILMTNNHDAGSRIIALPFRPGRPCPLAVIKVASHTGVNESTEREQIQMTDIRSMLSGPMRRSVPRPLGLLRYGRLTLGVESYMDGTPLAVSAGRWRAPVEAKIADLRLAIEWLDAFQSQTENGRMPWDAAAIERWLETPMARFERCYGVTQAERRLFDEARRRARELVGASFPLVRIHYDYGPWNLYRSRRGLNVIDWEFGRDWERDLYGPTPYDLLYFVTYWVHLAYRTGGINSERRAFYKAFVHADRSDPFVAAVHSALEEHARAHDIDMRSFPLFFVYVWLEQALHRVQRKAVINQEPADPRRNNPYLVFLDVAAMHADRFFAGMTGESLSG